MTHHRNAGRRHARRLKKGDRRIAYHASGRAGAVEIARFAFTFSHALLEDPLGSQRTDVGITERTQNFYEGFL